MIPSESQKGTTVINSKPVSPDTLQPSVQLVVGISAPLLMVSLAVFIMVNIMVVIWKYKKKSCTKHTSEQQDGHHTLPMSNPSQSNPTSGHTYEQPQINTSTVQINSAFTIEEECVNNGYTTLQQQDAHPIYSTVNAERSNANVDEKEAKHTKKEAEDDYEIEGPPVPAYNPEERSTVEYKREEGIEEMYAVVNKNWRKAQEEETEEIEDEESPPIPPYAVESLDTEVNIEPDREHEDGNY